MNSLVIILLLMITTVPSNYARLKQEDWYDPTDITFLSNEDFKYASLMSVEDFDEVSTPYEDPEARNTYYEGDMMIKADDEKKVAMYTAKRWPNARIPYIMENKFSQEERASIARGIMTLQDESCIKFVPKEDHDEDYVWMRKGQGCAAHVGRIGGQQWLILGQGCFHLETVVHELMHAVGFIHEQSRPDRDNYVKILWDNIKKGAERNFRKHTTDYLADHGFPYDLMSVMHYRQYAFSKNRKPTIVPKKEIPYLRCRGLECPSDQDIKKINYLYKCKDGKSGFQGSNSISNRPSRKKKSFKGGNFDKDFHIGAKFYESMPHSGEEGGHNLGFPRNMRGHQHYTPSHHGYRINPSFPPNINPGYPRNINHHNHPGYPRNQQRHQHNQNDEDEHMRKYHGDEDHDDGDQEYHTDWVPAEGPPMQGPCVGENCYQEYYDAELDQHEPDDTQVVSSIVPAPKNPEESEAKTNGFSSWFKSLFQW